jgi:hypothetical protein
MNCRICGCVSGHRVYCILWEPRPKKPKVQRAKRLAQGIVGRLEAYLLASPDEELTFQDMKIKFDCSIAALSRAVCMLREEGLLEDKPRVVRLAKAYR